MTSALSRTSLIGMTVVGRRPLGDHPQPPHCKGLPAASKWSCGKAS